MKLIVSGQEVLEAELIADAEKVKSICNDATQVFGEEAWNLVRENASGRPGPNVITGEYLDSIQLEVNTGEDGTSEAVIFSDAIFSNDLEYGREGQFAHPPYPHFGPAAEEIENKFLDYVLEKIDLL